MFTAPAVTRTKTWSNAPRERDNAHQEDQNVYHNGTAKGSAVRSIILLALASAGVSGIVGPGWADAASASARPPSPRRFRPGRPPPRTAAAALAASAPVRIVIPSLHVDAPVMLLGKTAGGSI
jgi:hypothetical protein